MRYVPEDGKRRTILLFRSGYFIEIDPLLVGLVHGVMKTVLEPSSDNYCTEVFAWPLLSTILFSVNSASRAMGMFRIEFNKKI